MKINPNKTLFSYCDIESAQELSLLKKTNFIEAIKKDYEKFSLNKPKPLGAIFNDCILRRLHNKEHLNQIHFNDFKLRYLKTFIQKYSDFKYYYLNIKVKN